MPYTWFKNYSVTLKNCDVIEYNNMLVIENEDMETIIDNQINVSDVISNIDDIVYYSSNETAKLFKYNLLFINCKNLKRYSYSATCQINENESKGMPFITSYYNITSNEWESTFQYNKNIIVYPISLDNIFISNCDNFDVFFEATKFDKKIFNSSLQCNIIDYDGIITMNHFNLGRNKLEHKKYHNKNFIYYWVYHNVYIDGVQVINPELPSFKKLQDEIAILKSNYDLLMSLFKSQKEELDAIKSAIIARS